MRPAWQKEGNLGRMLASTADGRPLLLTYAAGWAGQVDTTTKKPVSS